MCSFSLSVPGFYDPETLGHGGQFPIWEGRVNDMRGALWCVALQVPAFVRTSVPSGVLQRPWESGVPKARPQPRS